MKNNENYEMNLAKNNYSNSQITQNLSNNNNSNNNTQKDFYSQTQRSLMQSPMILCPEQFNNINNKTTKLGELNNANSQMSNDKLKDVIIYFI